MNAHSTRSENVAVDSSEKRRAGTVFGSCFPNARMTVTGLFFGVREQRK